MAFVYRVWDLFQGCVCFLMFYQNTPILHFPFFVDTAIYQNNRCIYFKSVTLSLDKLFVCI